MPLLDPPKFGGWATPCLDAQRVAVRADLGHSGVFSVPWQRRVTGPFLRAIARIKALNEDHVAFATSEGREGFPIPGRKRGMAGVYKVHQFGTYACRDATCCPGKKSNHSWALAVDINWAENPFHGTTKSWGRHDMPDYFIQAFEAEGFHWLAQFDPMHFERIQMDDKVLPPGQTGVLTVDHRQFLHHPTAAEEDPLSELKPKEQRDLFEHAQALQAALVERRKWVTDADAGKNEAFVRGQRQYENGQPAPPVPRTPTGSIDVNHEAWWRRLGWENAKKSGPTGKSIAVPTRRGGGRGLGRGDG
jgi:hypothetical protein